MSEIEMQRNEWRKPTLHLMTWTPHIARMSFVLHIAGARYSSYYDRSVRWL